MKSIQPPLAAIFFYDLFLQGRGERRGLLPPLPPGSATEKHLSKIFLCFCGKCCLIWLVFCLDLDLSDINQPI